MPSILNLLLLFVLILSQILRDKYEKQIVGKYSLKKNYIGRLFYLPFVFFFSALCQFY